MAIKKKSKKKSQKKVGNKKAPIKKAPKPSLKKSKQKSSVTKSTHIQENIIEKPIESKPINAASNLLSKLVNASIEEEKKKQSYAEKKLAQLVAASKQKNESAQKNVPITTTVTKRKRRKKQAKTWEEKAQSLPNIEVSNWPKLAVRNILITQAKPSELQNPYQILMDKYKVNVYFKAFLTVEGLTAQEFRMQRVDILEHKSIIFTSRLAIDHLFRLCQEMRITLPEETKYFCINEQVAYYMQKYMEFRKRRIFWGQGSLEDLKGVLKKNLTSKFLLPASDAIKEKVIDILDAIKAQYTPVEIYRTTPTNISNIKPEQFDMIAFFSPIAVESLKKSFPKLKQNNIRFAAYSHLTANKMKSLGYRVDVFAPTLEFPSLINAMAHYLLNAKKK